MTPEKFFDYLEGKLPPAEKERLERALLTDLELQREFASARQVHRGLERTGEAPGVARAGHRGRQLAAAFAVLVAMNVALGLIYIFHANKPSAQVQQAREEALRHQLQSSVEKSAAASFTPPTIGMEQITLPAPRPRQDEIAQAIIAAAAQAGGSGTKGLPNDDGCSVLVLLPGPALPAFRATLTRLGAPPAPPAPAASPNEPVRLELLLSAPPP